MTYDVYTNTIEEILKEHKFSWDDYLFLLNNPNVFKKIENIHITEYHYEESGVVPLVVYKKDDVLNASFLSKYQYDFLIENQMINDNDWIMVKGFESNKYWSLKYNNKSLHHYYKLYCLLDDLWSVYEVIEKYDYNENNYMEFFKKYLKNIKVKYTKIYMGRISVKEYEIIK